ncbi:Uncharacterised protein [Mycobacteroides abscessus subsp. abscessus]|nr:Uncharacterised protein [Mycobacteroides abscessus subsp. abscessus]
MYTSPMPGLSKCLLVQWNPSSLAVCTSCARNNPRGSNQGSANRSARSPGVHAYRGQIGQCAPHLMQPSQRHQPQLRGERLGGR